MKTPLIWLSGFVLSLAMACAWADAGRFQFVVGQVTVSPPGGPTRVAIKGGPVQEGDLIVTAADASAQLRMVDEGTIAIRPDTSLRIDAYRYAVGGGERGILDLIKGGLRTLTGLIGKARKDAYLVRTPTATIGVRGTDHEPVYVPEGGWSGAPGAESGTYDKVNSGATYIQTRAGLVELAANEVGFVPPRADALPVRLDRMPDFMRGVPAAQGKADARGVRGETARERGQGDHRPAPGQRPDRNPPPGLLAPRGGLNIQLPGAPVVAAGGDLTAAPLNLAVAAADQYSDHAGSGAGVNQPGDLVVLRDESGLIGVIGSSNGFRYTRGDARLVEAGATKLVDGGGDIPVRWGIYAGGDVVDQFGARQPRLVSVIGALPATSDAQLTALSNLGSQTFSLTGASRPANEEGLVGGAVNSAKVVVDFSQLSVTAATLRVTDARGAVFDGASAAPLPLEKFAHAGMPLAVRLTPPQGSPLAIKPDSGHLNGVLIGSGGVGLVGSYDMSYPVAGSSPSVSGVVVLSRP